MSKCEWFLTVQLFHQCVSLDILFGCPSILSIDGDRYVPERINWRDQFEKKWAILQKLMAMCQSIKYLLELPHGLLECLAVPKGRPKNVPSGQLQINQETPNGGGQSMTDHILTESTWKPPRKMKFSHIHHRRWKTIHVVNICLSECTREEFLGGGIVAQMMGRKNKLFEQSQSIKVFTPRMTRYEKRNFNSNKVQFQFKFFFADDRTGHLMEVTHHHYRHILTIIKALCVKH